MINAPAHLFMKIEENEKVAICARLEAEMTFIKKHRKKDEAAKYVHIYPEEVRTREDMFYFAMTFGAWLNELESGKRKVSPQVMDLFTQSDAKRN